MKKILYLDCFSGISGDMMAGSLLDAGLDLGYLKKELGKLDINGYRVYKKKVMAGSISATRFEVEVSGKQDLRDYSGIKKLMEGSGLSHNIKKTSLDIFEIIAAAEAKIHNKKISDIHFHEVGAVDSIIDITSTAIGLDALKIDLVISSPVPLGKGKIKTSHGDLPVPAPATLEILDHIPVYHGDFDFEVTTPTGAGIIKSLVREFGGFPPMQIETIGYGAGSRGTVDNPHGHGLPNVLRILIGNQIKTNGGGMPYYSGDTILLSANIDDSIPEILGYVMEKLNELETVRDAWLEGIYMKKNRPAFKLCVICDQRDEVSIARMIFSETSTIGIRRETVDRYCLERKIETIRLSYGEVEVKTAILDGKIINSAPEYESCRKLAKKTGKSLKDIYRDVGLFLSRR